MKKILRKLSSRKLWTAIVGIITGLGVVFGADGNTAETISGAIVTLLSSMTYIITEGAVDAKSVVKLADTAVTKDVE